MLCTQRAARVLEASTANSDPGGHRRARGTLALNSCSGLYTFFFAGAIKTLAGSGTRGYQDGGPTVARFSWPYGVAAAPDGEVVYVADSGNDCIRLASAFAVPHSNGPPSLAARLCAIGEHAFQPATPSIAGGRPHWPCHDSRRQRAPRVH